VAVVYLLTSTVVVADTATYGGDTMNLASTSPSSTQNVN